MSFIVKKYPHGTTSWVDLESSNVDKSRVFLEKLFNWKSSNAPTLQGESYTTFTLDSQKVAGLESLPQSMKNIPSHWNTYVTVSDLSKTLEKVTAAGGTIFMPEMQIMTEGKMAGIQDPTGARIMLWEAQDSIGATIVNTVGAMGWNELHTTDLQKAQDFYSKVLGWTFEYDEKSKYVTIKNNGRMNGGMMLIQPEWGDVPPNWMVYFTVKDITATTKKAVEIGGRMHTEIISIPTIGQFAIIAGPSGAVFTAIQLSTEPEHWKN